MTKILLAVSGSVATIKARQIVQLFQEQNCEIKVITTKSALHFIDLNDFEGITFYEDKDEWSAWSKRGDPVLHIELRKWADAMVIAPLSANTLAKIANGLCDNLLTCVARAWDFEKKIFFAPAMNTMMWNHPVTSKQTDVLKSWGYEEIPCVSKTLMCKDIGMGAMAEPETIVKTVMSFFK